MNTNKIDLIKAEVEKLKSQLLRGACSSQVTMETRCKEEAYNEVLAILDSMQEEHVSIWHDASEKPEKDKLCLVLSNINAIGGNKHLAYFVDNKETGKCGFLFGGYIGMDMVVKWAYVDDLINL